MKRSCVSLHCQKAAQFSEELKCNLKEALKKLSREGKSDVSIYFFFQIEQQDDISQNEYANNV